MSSSDWTPEAAAAAEAAEDAAIAAGQCPWSGMTIKGCQLVDLCDCFLPRTDNEQKETK